MSSMQFVTCNDMACPMNSMRQCHSKTISVGKDGLCLTRSKKDGIKVEVESYVDIAECSCSKCQHWELDEVEQKGVCGLREPLAFLILNPKNKDGKPGLLRPKEEVPRCDIFRRQINEPANSTIV